MDRYEKVDAHTIKVIKEQASEVGLINLIKTREDLLNKIKSFNDGLKKLDVIIAEAKKLGITPKEKDKEIEFPKGVASEKLGEEK